MADTEGGPKIEDIEAEFGGKLVRCQGVIITIEPKSVEGTEVKKVDLEQLASSAVGILAQSLQPQFGELVISSPNFPPPK